MIDRSVFRDEWAMLCERFRLTGQREPSSVMRQRYLEYLSPRLDTEQFRAAARVVYAEREFFPRPIDFVDAAGLSTETEALEQWDLCRRVMDGSAEAEAAMTDEGLSVLRLMGGARTLRMTALEDVQWRRKEFLQLYGTAAEAARAEALPNVTPESRAAIGAAGPIRLLGGTP